MNYGVTLLEITAAYQIFPNSGVYNTPHTILQIRDKQGNVIVNNDIESEVVISDQTATIMTKLLQNVVTSGTASSITLKNRVNVAGKTGTTTDDRDRWFIGYTPYYVAGVWFGYSMPQSLSAFSASKAPSVVIWDEVMNQVQDLVEQRNQERGEASEILLWTLRAVISCTYCIDSGQGVRGEPARRIRAGAELRRAISRLRRCRPKRVTCMLWSTTIQENGVANSGCPGNGQVFSSEH